MYNIKLMNKISKEGLAKLNDNFKIVESDNYDGLILRSYNLHETEFPLTCKVIARAGAGVNNIPVDRCSEDGIVVMNSPGANANAVKELVILSMLLSARNVLEGSNWVNSLCQNCPEAGIAKTVEKEKSNFVGMELMGKKVGVIGLGAIGVLVANALNDLGMKVYGYDPYISVEGAWNINSDINRTLSLEKIFKSCDFVTIHIPLMESTKNTVSRELLMNAKKGIRILNLARGGLVDEDALLEAIDLGIVKEYVTDFPNEKLVGKDKIICIPHLGASTPESEANCAKMVVSQMVDYLENGNIKNSVNFPNCDLGKLTHLGRLCITHRNIPNMIGQISTILAQGNVNIDNMINKNKGDYAYTMIDIDSQPDNETMERINTIEGVSMVRLIIG